MRVADALEDLVPPEGRAEVEFADCVHTGRIAGIDDLNRVSGQVHGDDAFQGGDVGAVVRLRDGRRLMVFGDTLRGSRFAGQTFVRNSMLVVAPDCIESVLPPDGGAVIPDRAGSGPAPVGYWPMSLRRVERDGFDLVTVSAQRVQTVGTGVFDFHTLGPAAAVFGVRPGGTPQLLTVRDLGPDDDDLTRPEWGAATVDDGGWLYLYGTARSPGSGGTGFSLHVARVRPDLFLDQDRWRYWDGAAWQPDPTRAAPLVAAEEGVSQTLSVFRHGPAWLVLSKRCDFVGTDLVVWRADSPEGPFDDGTTVGQLPSDAVTGELRYMPLAHPDLFPEEGTVVVSYSRNRTDLGAVIADPYAYRPRFVRVPLPQEARGTDRARLPADPPADRDNGIGEATAQARVPVERVPVERVPVDGPGRQVSGSRSAGPR